jgi:hypothetical protein
MYRKLIIDNIETDLPTDFNPSLTYEINEDGVIVAARAKRSIRLPATTTNDTLFQDWGAVATENPKATVFRDFTFESGGITLFAGKAQLQSSDLNSARYRFKASGYDVDLYGTNADWFFLLKDTLLRDLTYTDKIYNTAAVITGWDAAYGAGDESGFCLVKWKEWATAGQVDIDEFTPFLFIRSILDKAFDSIGYTILSDFFDSPNFKRLILLAPLPDRYPAAFSEDYLNVQLSQVPTNTSSISNTFAFSNFTQPNIGTPYNSATGFYTAPFSGYYEVAITANVLSSVGTWAAYFAACVNGGAFPINGSVVGFGSGLLTPPVSGNDFGSATSDVVFLNAGDTISLLHYFTATDPSTTFEFSLNIIGEAETAFGSLIAFRYLLQDWKVRDFIKGLQQMFNLRFEADVQRQTIRIEPADNYLMRTRPTAEQLYTGFYTDNLTDLGQNLDLSVEGKLYSDNDQPQTTVLQYITEGETDEFVDENNVLGFFAAQYTLPADKYNSRIETKENPFFAKTISTIDNELRDVTSLVEVQLPLIYPQNYILDPTATEANYQVQPRILYFAGFRGLDGIINYSFLGAPITYPYAFMTNYNSPQDWSISFANETVQGQSVTGLLDAFYLQDFARKRIAKRLEIAYFWDSLQILALSFRNKIVLDRVEYILQKIDGYKPLEDSSTLTVLIKDQAPEQEDVDAITGGLVLGIANLT